MIKVVVVIFLIFLPTIKIIAQMSWYDRAKGRRKFRVFEEDDQPMQVLDVTFYDNDGCWEQFQEEFKEENVVNEEADDTLQVTFGIQSET